MSEQFEELEIKPIPRKRKYTIRMDITFGKEVTQEEAERLIFNAISRAGVIGHCGGID